MHGLWKWLQRDWFRLVSVQRMNSLLGFAVIRVENGLRTKLRTKVEDRMKITDIVLHIFVL